MIKKIIMGLLLGAVAVPPAFAIDFMIDATELLNGFDVDGTPYDKTFTLKCKAGTVISTVWYEGEVSPGEVRQVPVQIKSAPFGEKAWCEYVGGPVGAKFRGRTPIVNIAPRTSSINLKVLGRTLNEFMMSFISTKG